MGKEGTDQELSGISERREKLLNVAFELFAANSIEAVKLTDIAEKSGIGIATLYRYFGTKPCLVIEIGTRKWFEYFDAVEIAFQKRGGNNMTAAEELDFFLDCFIELYQNHKEVLRFNRNFDTYVKHEGCTAEQMRPYNDAVNLFAMKFHRLYQNGMNDGTLDIRFPEKKFFINLLYIMLSAAGKYAEGLIYPVDDEPDKTEELYMLKHIILNAFVRK